MIRWCYDQMINKKSSLWSDLISRPPRLHHWEFTPYAPQLTRPISCILDEIQMEYKYRWNRNANTNATTITNINSNTITNNSPPVKSWGRVVRLGRCHSAPGDLTEMIMTSPLTMMIMMIWCDNVSPMMTVVWQCISCIGAPPVIKLRSSGCFWHAGLAKAQVVIDRHNGHQHCHQHHRHPHHCHFKRSNFYETPCKGLHFLSKLLEPHLKHIWPKLRLKITSVFHERFWHIH